MRIRTALLTATAMGLLMAAAEAGDNNRAVIWQADDSNSASVDQAGGSGNTTKFEQDGASNMASVTQDGDGNRAGTHMKIGAHDPTETASNYNYIFQDGASNSLTILQTQKGNSVAVDGNFIQTGNFNTADVTQHGGASSGNQLKSVTQTSSGAATEVTNELTVLQEGAVSGDYTSPPSGSSDYNYPDEIIYTVSQTHISGAKNSLSLTQLGGTHSAGNRIVTASQNGSDNTGTITQDGRRNRLEALQQTGDGNDATAYFEGQRNGEVGLGQLPEGFALSAGGIADQSIIQAGTDNSVDLAMYGDDNQFGINQSGASNTVGTLSFTGDRNEIGVNQTGDDNELGLSAIIGDDNDIGVSQDGDSNYASVNTMLASTSDDNAVRIFQTSAPSSAGNDATVGLGGNHNLVDITQDGLNEANVTANGSGNDVDVDQVGDNLANVHIGTVGPGSSSDNVFKIDQNGTNEAEVETHAGNTNYLNVDQDGGSGGANTVSIYMWSSFTNRPTHSFGGVAGDVATASSLDIGDVIQDGSLNSVSLDVGNLSYSLNNDFALSQTGGNGNSITGQINGNSNQVAVAQVGGGNVTSFSQLGNFNSLGVSQ